MTWPDDPQPVQRRARRRAEQPLAGLLAAGVPVGTASSVHATVHRTPVSHKLLESLLPERWRHTATRAAATAAACAQLAQPSTLAALAGAADQPTSEVSPCTAESWSVDATGPAAAGPDPSAPPQPRPATSRTPAGKNAPPAARLSRAAALRHAAAVRAARQAQPVAPALAPIPVVAEPVAAAIGDYRPKAAADRATWSGVAAACRELATRTEPATEQQARSLMCHLSGYAAWLLSPSGPCAGSTSLAVHDLAVLERVVTYTEALTAQGRRKTSVATIRSELRRAARTVLPSDAVPSKLPRDPVAAPYTPGECAALTRLALHQPTPERRRKLCATVGLVLGAGVTPGELRDLAPTHLRYLRIDPLADGAARWVLVVDIPGARPRTVAVREDYRHLVEAALAEQSSAGLGLDRPFIGELTGKDVTTLVKRRATDAAGRAVTFDVGRLRSTWLFACMHAPLPLPTLLAAAGLQSAHSLSDLIRHTATPDPSIVAALLASVPDATGGEA